MAMKTSQMAKTAPRILKIIRPMPPAYCVPGAARRAVSHR
jgi:hypothetical protein